MLRLAWRDALRAKARSALVLLLIALPVIAVTAADIVIATSRISGTEAIDRRLGSGAALVQFTGIAGRVYQGFDPENGSATLDSSGDTNEHTGPSDIARTLGRPVNGIEWSTYAVNVSTDRGAVGGKLVVLDTTSPLAKGVVEVSSGRLPARDGEVSINRALAQKGFALGDRVELDDFGAATVVGIAEGTRRTEPEVMARPGTFASPGAEGSWLIGPEPVSWSDVLALNQQGAIVVSREVLANPPPDSALPKEVRMVQSSVRSSLLPVIVLISVMALIEVVLLAGPAFAVTARSQSRALALMVASGGTPRQARRVVLGTGVVLGGLAAGAGVGLGVLLAWVGLPLAQRTSPTWYGPFDVPWRDALIVAGFGLASAILAALVPAIIAARQDVVAVLAGRRGDRAGSRRSPVLGGVLMAAAVALAAYGSLRRGTTGAYPVAISAIVAVLAMILLVPSVVVLLARLARRLPLSLRFAARDAARHRTRTVPAVAAVAATVAGVVALGVATASDEAKSRAGYDLQFARGWGAVTGYTEVPWQRVGDAARAQAPPGTITDVTGLAMYGEDGHEVELRLPVTDDGLVFRSTQQFGTDILVADNDRLVQALPGLNASQRSLIAEAVASGGAAVLTSMPVEGEQVRLRARAASGPSGRWTKVTVPATFVEADLDMPMLALVSPRVLSELPVQPRVTGLLIDGRHLSPDEQADLTERLHGVAKDVTVYVERGFQQDPAVRIVYLVLSALAGVLMLGGTLTTTFLALSDARPDLATLAAVGAAPRRRRTVAASYAVVVGLLGAVLGVVVGLIPGIAIARPLTASFAREPGVADHYLAVPWTLIGLLVVALPLLTALAVGLAARSRLPLVARLS